MNVGRGEFTAAIGLDSAEVPGLSDFRQIGQPRLFHHFGDHLPEAGAPVGGNLLADLYDLGNGDFVVPWAAAARQ